MCSHAQHFCGCLGIEPRSSRLHSELSFPPSHLPSSNLSFKPTFKSTCKKLTREKHLLAKWSRLLKLASAKEVSCGHHPAHSQPAVRLRHEIKRKPFYEAVYLMGKLY